MTTPTGRIELQAGAPVLVLQRTFRAPIEDVWASVTEPDRLARWIGTFTGDPAAGSVQFVMTAEDGAAEETVQIRECTPPHALRVTSISEQGTWSLDITLAETDGITTMTFAHPGLEPGQADDVGPGWEYYLDRWVAAESGADVAAIDFERDYYPAMQEHYRQAWAAATP